MNVLVNQTIYQCEYCGKRLLSKNGAKMHEEDYCYKSPIKERKRLEKIMKCNHKWDMHYSPMAGESHLLEPDYQYCIECGVHDLEWRKLSKQ